MGETFYPGQTGNFPDQTIYMAFIALDHTQGPGTPIFATATDFAGNQGRSGIAHHINARNFKKDTIPITDRFLNWKMPEFNNQVQADAGMSPLEVFLKVNQDLRKANYETVAKVTARSDNKIHWHGDFLRLPHAANRAGFADSRDYIYKKKKIDHQYHLGVDLASLEHSPVPAANSGRVAFADALGIYGNTVILDHGFGLFSMYAHLSFIGVKVDQTVKRGEIIGKTGRSGLAGGDHLHFSMLVHQTFVNPLEWWDPNWIKNNIQANISAVH
ncbi:MAG: M23 family metallopeptidase [Desulfosarcinaceae bacterium]